MHDARGGAPAAASNEELDLLIRRVGRFLLRNSSEGSFDVDETMRGIAGAYRARLDVLLMMESMSLVVTHSDHTQSSFVVHAQPSLERLDLVSEFKLFAAQIRAGELDAAGALDHLEALATSRDPFPWWLRLMGVMLFAAGFAPSMQATWRELGISLVLGAVTAVVLLVGERVRMLRVMLPLVAATVVSLVAFTVFNVKLDHGGPVLVMIPALFVMIPGDFLCAAAAELAVGQFTVGTIRLVQSLFVLFQLAGGVVIGAQLSGAGTSSLMAASTVSDLPWALVVLAWIPFTIGMALTFSARLKDVSWLLFGVYLAWGVQLLGSVLFGQTAGTFLAAVVLAFAGVLLGHSPHRPPSLVIILGGVFVLTVGSMAFRGLTTLEGGHLLESFHDLVTFANIAGALTFGLIIGTTAGIAILRRSVTSIAEEAARLR